MDSIAPAARTLTRLWRHPFVKWVLGIVGGALVASFTTGLYPIFRGWAVTRVSVAEIDKDCERPERPDDDCPKAVREYQRSHTFNAERYRSESDFSKLNHTERVTWLYDQHVLERRKLVLAYRQAVGLEAELRMIAPAARAEAAKRKAAQVRAKYDEYILKGMEPEAAAAAALTDQGF